MDKECKYHISEIVCFVILIYRYIHVFEGLVYNLASISNKKKQHKSNFIVEKYLIN